MRSRFDAEAGRPDGEGPAAQSGSSRHVENGGQSRPMPLGGVLARGASSAWTPKEPVERDVVDRHGSAAWIAGRPFPRGWPTKAVSALWTVMKQPRPPLRVMVGGAEGGVGTSTVCAVLGELIAAASPGHTVIADQCGSAWNSVVRRLVGDHVGLTADQATAMLRLGATGTQVLGLAPQTSAGAALVDDRRGYTPLRDIDELVHVANGTLVIDAGRVDNVFLARLDMRPVALVVGRADTVGAEAACAAITSLRERGHRPVAVLSSSSPSSSMAARRRVRAACTLVAATGIRHLVHLPHDPQLASSRPLRLDQVTKSSALAAMRVLTQVLHLQGEINAHRRPASAGPVAGPAPA